MEKPSDTQSLINVVLPADDVPLVYLERHLLITEDQLDEQDSNHAPIFRSRVHCMGKTCNTIVDGGSAMNVIAKKAVEKIKLPTTKHPRPYKIAWVNYSTIPVDKQCIVPFTLGSYEDTIKCDVIPMKVTHNLWSPLAKEVEGCHR